jgi:hypothetical protein
MKRHIRIYIFTLAVSALILLNTGANAQQADTSFKAHGGFSGQIFFDYGYQIGADTTPVRGKGYYASSPKDFQAFDIRRIYLGYDYWFSPMISAGILLAHEPAIAPPSSGVAGAAGLLNDGTNGFYLKGANVRFKNALPMSTITVGQQPTPGFALSESIWGYRSIEKTFLDFRGLEGSNDMGVSLKGTLDDAGNFGYTAMIGNGANQKDETNKFKKYYAEVYAMFLDKKIIVEFFADANYTGANSNDTNKSTTLKGFIALNTDPITVGVEYAFQNQTVKNNPNVTPGGLSIFAHAPIVEKTLAAFARFDMFTPNSGLTDRGFKENFITAGLDWQPITNVHIEPNIWIDTYTDQSAAALERKSDIVGRVTFFTKL